jgi:hypothetical protein
MSFVYSKIINERICIESDSRVLTRGTEMRESSYGCLKSIILFPQLCISFAGDPDLAENAIQEIYKRKSGINLPFVLEVLLKYNKNNSNEVVFIVCSLQKNPELIKVANAQVERNLPVVWIGDKMALEKFIPLYHEKKSVAQNDIEAVRNAFAEVIASGNVNSVGDFHISTITETSITGGSPFFRYIDKSFAILNEPQSTTITAKEKIEREYTLTWGTTEGGSYGVSYFSSVDAYKPAMALYFDKGNYGVLYYPKHRFEPIVMKDISSLDFLHLVNSNYGIPLKGMRLVNNSAFQLVDMRFPEKII